MEWYWYTSPSWNVCNTSWIKLSQSAKPDLEGSVSEENISEDGEVSLDEVSETENQQDSELEAQENSENNDTSNSQ